MPSDFITILASFGGFRRLVSAASEKKGPARDALLRKAQSELDHLEAAFEALGRRTLEELTDQEPGLSASELRAIVNNESHYLNKSLNSKVGFLDSPGVRHRKVLWSNLRFFEEMLQSSDNRLRDLRTYSGAFEKFPMETCLKCRCRREGAEYSLAVGRIVRKEQQGAVVKVSYEYKGHAGAFLCHRCVARKLLPYKLLGLCLLLGLGLFVAWLHEEGGGLLAVIISVIAVVPIAWWLVLPRSVVVSDRLGPLLRRLLTEDVEEKYGSLGNGIGDTVVWTGKEFGDLRLD